jgi:hypothetical protein
MLVKLVLELTTEAVGPTVTGGGLATVVVEVVDPGEEDSKDINLYGSYLYLKVALAFA